MTRRNHSGSAKGAHPRPAPAKAFTLIELILVMALLMIVTSISAPSLGKFFAGRTISSEAKRIVGLTRYGQSRAVSEGVPMVLWLDLTQRSYRLAEDETFTVDQDAKALDFNLAADLKMDVLDPSSMQNNRATIRFLPDGSFGINSCEALVLDDGKREKLWVTLAENRLHYEISKEPGHWLQARR